MYTIKRNSLYLLCALLLLSTCSCNMKAGKTVTITKKVKLQGKNHRLVWGVPNHPIKKIKSQ